MLDELYPKGSQGRENPPEWAIMTTAFSRWKAGMKFTVMQNHTCFIQFNLRVFLSLWVTRRVWCCHMFWWSTRGAWCTHAPGHGKIVSWSKTAQRKRKNWFRQHCHHDIECLISQWGTSIRFALILGQLIVKIVCCVGTVTVGHNSIFILDQFCQSRSFTVPTIQKVFTSCLEMLLF